MFAVAPLVAAMDVPLALGDRWDSSIARPFDFGPFDKIELFLYFEEYVCLHRCPPSPPDQQERTDNRTVVRPGDKAWTRLSEMIRSVPIHGRAYGLRSLEDNPDVFEWLVRLSNNGVKTHDLKFFKLGPSAGDLDGRPIFLGGDLPEMLFEMSGSEIAIRWPTAAPVVGHWVAPIAPQTPPALQVAP